MSKDGTQACSSCHDMSANGANSHQKDKTPGGWELPLNTPTVFNAALNFRLNWEGNFRTLESQAEAVLEAAGAMGGGCRYCRQQIECRSANDAPVRRSLRSGADRDAVLDAIATYERSLLTPDSRFDRWLTGETSALSNEEIHGYNLFKSLGCVSCHQGVNVGGNLFQRHGIFHPLASPKPEILRVPSLRNVATTAPYFHDGSAPTLDDAVRKMGYSQLNRDLSDEQLHAIIAFLRTLTGDLPRQTRGSARAMKTPLAAAGVLLVALTWLSFRGLNLDAQRFDRALQSLDHFGLAERALQRDILRARVGLLRNYDPLVKEADDLRGVLNELRDAASGSAREKEATDALASLIDRQEDYVEQFKSKIALLRNSLTYFGLFSSRLGTADGGDRSLQAVNAVSAAMLRLTLDTSTANSLEVEHSLENLDKELLSADDPDTVKALLAHGRLCTISCRRRTRFLAAVFALPIKANQEDLRTVLTADQLASREEAREFRVVVFSLSLLLMGILIHLGRQLRARALSLRWRAAVEYVIADISTSLIDCPPKETNNRLNEALHRLAGCIGADRAYFIYADDATKDIHGAARMRHSSAIGRSIHKPCSPTYGRNGG